MRVYQVVRSFDRLRTILHSLAHLSCCLHVAQLIADLLHAHLVLRTRLYLFVALHDLVGEYALCLFIGSRTLQHFFFECLLVLLLITLRLEK